MTRQERTEDKGRVGRDTSLSTLAVRKSRRYSEQTLTTDLHACDTGIPAFDDFALAELELERIALSVRVEDLAVLKLANVANLDEVTSLGHRATADLVVLDLKATLEGLDLACTALLLLSVLLLLLGLLLLLFLLLLRLRLLDYLLRARWNSLAVLSLELFVQLLLLCFGWLGLINLYDIRVAGTLLGVGLLLGLVYDLLEAAIESQFTKVSLQQEAAH